MTLDRKAEILDDWKFIELFPDGEVER